MQYPYFILLFPLILLMHYAYQRLAGVGGEIVLKTKGNQKDHASARPPSETRLNRRVGGSIKSAYG